MTVCPVACGDRQPSSWTVYTSLSRLRACSKPVLFDFSIYNPVEDPDTPVKLRVCTTDGANTIRNAYTNRKSSGSPQRQAACTSRPTAVESMAALAVVHEGPDLRKGAALISALQSLEKYFTRSSPSCENDVMFAYDKGVVAGAYVGAAFGGATVSSVVARLVEEVRRTRPGTRMAAQLCGPERSGRHTLGIFLDSMGNLTAAQAAVRGWNEAACQDDGGPSKSIPIFARSAARNVYRSVRGSLAPRQTTEPPEQGTCKTIRVGRNELCDALAKRCGISTADFAKYNPGKDFCWNLLPGQPVCCGPGRLPDIRPKPSENGTCATHLVTGVDDCSFLAASNGLTRKEIEEFNNGTTWGWYGCNRLLADSYICLSEGDPPMPFPIPDALCGPTKPGTSPPSEGQELKDLNPCPLNACCNVWGHCGISGDFCNDKKLPAGNPGTSAHPNGCVASCGTYIVKDDTKPSSFGRIAYYESWNFNRSCLWQHAEKANTDGTYTIIHWAFADINSGDWTVNIVDDYDQWDRFESITDMHKVISFGGWTFSNNDETYDVLRQAMSPQNRNQFATNVAQFVFDNDLSGVDFDWEYPGATDIPGTPGGFPDDGANYLEFLTVMKQKLSTDGVTSKYTMSIAAPASFWYLKNFPIKKMSEQLSYIVYMTYDLHGQWDVGNDWAMEGCPAGNCLRSHVNVTETEIALSMITKAGVPASMIYVGESSYGRSFKMSQAGCDGPMCTFLGDKFNSQAKKGECTDTAGYISNAEISRIIAERNESAIGWWHDSDSESDILVYEDTEWVAYMSHDTKESRREQWRKYNFAGTIDWAVDLQAFTDDEFTNPDDWQELEDQPPPPPLKPCPNSYSIIEAVEAELGLSNLPSEPISQHCLVRYALGALQETLDLGLVWYDGLIDDGYDKKHKTFADAVAGTSGKTTREWMYEHGDDYFTCDVVERSICCKACEPGDPGGGEDGECRYCHDDWCDWSDHCSGGSGCDVNEKYFNVSGPCPPDYSERAGEEPETGYYQTIYWQMDSDKEEQFYLDLFNDIGIPKDYIEFQDEGDNVWCSPADDLEYCQLRGWDFDFPTPVGYDADDVLNPKDVVEDVRALLRDNGVAEQFGDVIKQIEYGIWAGEEGDLIDALALPSLLVYEAATQMEAIADTVDEWDEDKRKNTIMAFVTAILFLAPFVGEFIGAISSLAGLAFILGAVGTVGGIGAGTFELLDSENSVLTVLTIILAPLGVLDVVGVTMAADAALALSPDDLGKLGPVLSARVKSAHNTNKLCALPLALESEDSSSLGSSRLP
ncbi:killer toxin alpha/beta [Lasiosphaeria hispida]|uniref:chitinase n=1 Tax=Lasiosphaeria hispida TaxID=260671 RepID=A0AAJ0HNJ5_9PEZI|nr:killer toxin alpha/beta [Lasiosphaeria hispida]